MKDGTDKPVTLTGLVTKMASINPHSWITLMSKNPMELSRTGLLRRDLRAHW